MRLQVVVVVSCSGPKFHWSDAVGSGGSHGGAQLKGIRRQALQGAWAMMSCTQPNFTKHVKAILSIAGFFFNAH